MANVHENLDFSSVGVIPKSVPFTGRYNVVGKEIRVIAGDRGGWNAVEPVLTLALDAGCAVHAYFVATCGEQLAEGRLVPDKRINVQRIPTDEAVIKTCFEGPHSLTVVGVSQSAQGAEAAAATIRFSGASRLVVEDMYGSAHPALRQIRKEALFLKCELKDLVQCVCVSDQFSADLLLSPFPALQKQVVITGGPQFDKALLDKDQFLTRRHQLRDVLGVDDQQPVFLLVGGLNGTAEMLHVVETGIRNAGLTGKARVILRSHPRATSSDKELARLYRTNLKHREEWFTDVDRQLAPTADDLLPPADFVISGYSTTLRLAILHNMSGVVYAGTPAFQRDLRAEKGLDRPPEVVAGAGWYVQDGVDMARVIRLVRTAEPSVELQAVKDSQARLSRYCDGYAAERVWQEMQKLMG